MRCFWNFESKDYRSIEGSVVNWLKRLPITLWPSQKLSHVSNVLSNCEPFLLLQLGKCLSWWDWVSITLLRMKFYTIILFALVVPWIPHGFFIPHVTPSLVGKGLVLISEASPSYEASLGHSIKRCGTKLR